MLDRFLLLSHKRQERRKEIEKYVKWLLNKSEMYEDTGALIEARVCVTLECWQ